MHNVKNKIQNPECVGSSAFHKLIRIELTLYSFGQQSKQTSSVPSVCIFYIVVVFKLKVFKIFKLVFKGGGIDAIKNCLRCFQSKKKTLAMNTLVILMI